MSEIVTALEKELKEVKRVGTNILVEAGLLPENRSRMSDSEFYAEHGMTKTEYEAKYGKGSFYVASMPEEVREAELAEARAEMERQDEEQMAELTEETAKKKADQKERQAYKSRGNRTQEEYDAHMAKSEADHYAKLEYIETYREVEIYRFPNGSYEARGMGISASDVVTLRYLIDSQLDDGNAEAEIKAGSDSLAKKTKSRREPLNREPEIASSETEPDPKPVRTPKAEPVSPPVRTPTKPMTPPPRARMR